MSDERGDMTELLDQCQAAADAAYGDSNDDEIELLRDALEMALARLGLEMPDGRATVPNAGVRLVVGERLDYADHYAQTNRAVTLDSLSHDGAEAWVSGDEGSYYVSVEDLYPLGMSPFAPVV